MMIAQGRQMADLIIYLRSQVVSGEKVMAQHQFMQIGTQTDLVASIKLTEDPTLIQTPMILHLSLPTTIIY